jgi:CheY-like chemotaxis protein
MGAPIYVKVLGFADVERHALNTIFRLAQDSEPHYELWTVDTPVPPHVALVDLDLHESDVMLASPNHNANLKVIGVGARQHPAAWRHFERPVPWTEVLEALASLFLTVDLDLTESSQEAPDTVINVAPGMKMCLVVDDVKEHQLYLRTRLALSGVVHVHEATTAESGLEQAKQRYLDVVIVSAELPQVDVFALIEKLAALEPAIGSLVLTAKDASWQVRERAEQLGCVGVLAQPFDPVEVQRLLSKT